MKKPLLALFFLFAYPLLSQTDTIDFEAPDTVITIDVAQTDNIWQKGSPSKTVFDSAYSGQRAIVTDTLNAYPHGNLSSFVLDFSLKGMSPSISFYHRWETDTLRDGGFVEISFDDGNSWAVVLDTFNNYQPHPAIAPFGIDVSNFPTPADTLFNGEGGFSGSSGNWQYSRILFPCLALKTGMDIKLKFNFISDSTGSNGDGWIIDHIVTNNEGGCSGLTEEPLPAQLQAYPNPADKYARVALPDGKYIEDGRCEIRNVSGKILKEQKIRYGNEFKLDLERFESGIYIYTIYEDGQIFGSGKILKVD